LPQHKNNKYEGGCGQQLATKTVYMIHMFHVNKSLGLWS